MNEEQEEPIDRRDPFSFHKCNWCTFETKSSRVIRSHLRKHEVKFEGFSCQTSTLEAFECQFCYFEHNLKIAVDRHESLFHGGHSPDSELELKGYVCDKCDFETHSLLVFARHVCDNSHRNVSVLRKKIKPKRCIVNDKRFECEQCPLKTNSKSNLKIHILAKHTDPNDVQLFECEQCSYKAKIKSYVKRHILTKHVYPNKFKWFECGQCSFKTKHKPDLKRHTYLIHAKPDEVQWLQCEHCSYKTRNKNNLKYHIMSKHTSPDKVKWIECEHCSYKTKKNNCLKYHIRSKHTISDKVKWFECEQCSYKTRSKLLLRKHVKLNHEIKWL